MRRAVTVAALLLLSTAGRAQGLPVPPCGAPAEPPYAAEGEQPNVRAWGANALAAWAPPACAAKAGETRHLVVALAGTFPHAGTVDELVARFGALSKLRGVRYWSVTDNSWRELITAADALEGQDVKRKRQDFSAAELKAGNEAYFAQSDTRSSGETVYRLRVKEASADRVVVEMENVTTVRFFFVPIFNPRELRTVYVLERRGDDRWGYYALVFANTARAEGNEASFVNRAVAIYRRFIGVPDDGAPPPVAH